MKSNIVNQIIAFINPSKFDVLITKEGYQFDTAINKISILDKIGNLSQIECSDNDLSNKWNEGQIILIPDECAVKYIPKIKYKVLCHSETAEKVNNFDDLKKHQNCIGFLETIEEAGTIYDKIVKLIEEDSVAMTFEEIFKLIPNKNAKLEATLEFLHGCLGGTPSKIVILKANKRFTEKELTAKENRESSIEEMINSLEGKSKDQYNNALRDLRDLLLIKSGIV